MSIEEMIRAWKDDDRDARDRQISENPIGHELSDEELEHILGGARSGECGPNSCTIGQTCAWTNCKPGATRK